MAETTIRTGSLVELTVTVGPWAAGTIAKVIPTPYKIIDYKDVNSTGERKAFETEQTVWIIVSNKAQLDTHTKFPVALAEIKEVVR